LSSNHVGSARALRRSRSGRGETIRPNFFPEPSYLFIGRSRWYLRKPPGLPKNNWSMEKAIDVTSGGLSPQFRASVGLGAKHHERTNLIAYRHGLRASEVVGVEVGCPCVMPPRRGVDAARWGFSRLSGVCRAWPRVNTRQQDRQNAGQEYAVKRFRHPRPRLPARRGYAPCQGW
jgi:hypothetical protein